MGESVAKKVKRNSGSKSQLTRDGRDDPVGLLQTLETSLDDIRTLITCRVCVRPLFEPYTIECGHTFCYGCLVRWFERDHTKKSCPDCRADVLRPPAPAYLVRDMTQIFANRAELMPAGETTQEHKIWQEEEAALVEKDRATTGLKGGLFRGCFRLTRQRQLVVIRDEEDGVYRCPRCTWELQDGHCESCGYPMGEESDDMSDSDSHGRWDDDLYDMEGAAMEELVGALGEDARIGENIPNVDLSEHGYSSEDGSFEGIPRRMHRRDRRITAQLNRLRTHPEEEPPYDSFHNDTDEDSEDEEVGSLDDFVVNDVENGPDSVRDSTRSLHWETDEGTDGEGNQPQDSDNDQNSQDEDRSNGTPFFATAQYDTEDESDEGPILRSRRQARRRSVASNQSSGSNGNGGSGVSQALNALRVRNGYNGSRVSANNPRNIPYRNSDASEERSAGGLIEIESDSQSPVVAQHTRRRRAIPNRLSSSADSDVDASSGTATVGRDSPRPNARLINRRNGGIPPASQTSNPSSPILIESSPTRSANNQLAVPGAFPQGSSSAMPPASLRPNNSHHIGTRAPTRANRRAENSNQGISTRHSPSDASQSNGLQQRQGPRRRSPLPFHAHPRSPRSRQSHSPTAMEMFEQGRRDRQAQKNERRAERRRLKAEREQRGRSQNGLSPSPGPSNHYEDLW